MFGILKTSKFSGTSEGTSESGTGESASRRVSGEAEGIVPRRFHRKSRTGCKRCKERRVKCDERRPVCLKCEIHYENIEMCEYESDLLSSSEVSSFEWSGGNADPQRSTPRLSSILSKRIYDQSWLRGLPSGRVDPFETFPECKEPDIELLLSHYFSSAGFNMFFFRPTTDVNLVIKLYLPLVWEDELLFHVTLLLSASHLDRTNLKPYLERTRRLTEECMRLLKKRITEPLESSLSDHTLSAVAGLAAVEHQKRAVKMVRVHMNGLRHMLNLRGGLGALAHSNPIIATIVLSVFLSTIGEELPRTDKITTMVLPTWLVNAAKQSGEEEHFIDLEANDVRPDYAGLLLNVRLIVRAGRRPDEFSSVQKHQDVLTLLISTLEQLVYIEAHRPAVTHQEVVASACHHALVVYLLVPWRFHQPNPLLAISNAQRASILALHSLILEERPNALLLWLLFVTATASSSPDQIEHKWCVAQIADVCRQLSIKTWKETKSRLKTVVWNGSQDEELQKSVWRMVERRNKEEEENE